MKMFEEMDLNHSNKLSLLGHHQLPRIRRMLPGKGALNKIKKKWIKMGRG